MKSKRQSGQPVSPDEEASLEKTGVNPTPNPIAYKTVLTAIVISIVIISALWIFVIRQEESQVSAALVAAPDMLVHEAAGLDGLQSVELEDQIGKIDRRMASIADRVDQGLEAQHNRSVVTDNRLSDISQEIQAINSAITDQQEFFQEVGREIKGVTSQLDKIINEIQALKAIQRKSAVRRKSGAIKAPPFQLDAIDRWDDQTYVATSQGGRVEFLKTGEQRSGWKVTRIDRLKGRVSLQGPSGQRQSVTLPR